MKRILLIFCCVFAGISLFGQVPTEDDCANAIDISADLDGICVTYDPTMGSFTPDGVATNCAGLNSGNVWFIFNAQGSIIDINATSGAPVDVIISLYQVIDPGDPCGSLKLISCDTTDLSNNSLNVGSDYYISINVLDGAGADQPELFDLCVENLPAPPNDDPCDSEEILTGSCTPGYNTGSGFDFQPIGGCNNTNYVVFYDFEISDPENGIEIDINQITLGDEIFVGLGQYNNGCTGTFTLIDFVCNAADLPFSTTGLIPGETYYIAIGSDANDAGNFEVCIDPLSPEPCVDGDACESAFDLGIVTGDVANQVCETGCNENASNFPTGVGGCYDFPNPTAWYSFDAAADVGAVTLSVESDELLDLQIAIFAGDCNGLNTIAGGCNTSSSGTVFIPDLDIPSGNATYYLAVSDFSGNMGEFEICVTGNNFEAICNIENTLEEVSSSIADTPVGGPYCPGEIVEFCYEIQNADYSSGCQWLMGIIPSFGNGWDPTSFDAQGKPTVGGMTNTGPGSGTWGWWAPNAVHYNADNTLLTVVPAVNGLKFCSILEPNCSNLGMTNPQPGWSNSGTGLPGGWYAIQNGSNLQPEPDANNEPDHCWGDDPCSPNLGGWKVCWELKARSFPECEDDPSFTDCSINVMTFADGEIGDWQNFACFGELPTYFTGSVLCSDIPDIMAEATPICSGQTTAISITSSQDPLEYTWTVDLSNAPNVSGAVDGTGPFIFQELTNNGSSVETVVYNIEGKKFGCPALIEVEQEVYPAIETSTDDENGCAQGTYSLIDYVNIVQGGADPIEYEWSNGSTGTNVNIQVNTTTQYFVTITDDAGCSAIDSFTIFIDDLFDVEILGDTSICADLEFTTLTAIASGGSGVFESYVWETPDGMVDQGSSNILNAMTTGTYSLTVEDDKGCPGVATVDVFINPLPEAGLDIVPNQLDICPGADPLLIIAFPFYTDPDGESTEFQFDWEVPLDYSGNPSSVGLQNTFETDIPGIYTLTITDDFGCQVDTTFEITLNEAPPANSAIIGDCFDPDGTGVFDLTTLAFEINPDPDVVISFYEDEELNFEIPNPEMYEGVTGIIYAVVMDDVCPSEPVEILLVFEAEIVVNDAMLESCITGSNEGLFNLIELNPTINSEPGIEIVWYSNPDTTDLILDPANFMSGATTVYAVAINSIDCRSRAAEIQLTLISDLQAAPADLNACNEGGGIGTFDLTTVTSVVQNGNSAGVLWFTDATLTTEVGDPTAYSGASGNLYAVLEDIDGCLSAPVLITLNVTTDVLGNSFPIDECDLGNNTGNFDLTAANPSINGNAGVTFTWYLDAGLTMPIADPTNYNSGPGQVFVFLQEGDCVSDPIAIDLTVSQTLAAFDALIDECDPGTGTGTFDLNDANSTVNGGSGNTVNYFLDLAGTMPIADPANFDAINNTIVYAQVNDQGCVSDFKEVTLTVSINTPAFDASLLECNQGAGTGTFDLTVADNTVNGGDGSLTVTYYSDVDATMPIADPLNYVSGNGTVYAVANDGPCKSLPVEVTLQVDFTISGTPTSLETCDDGAGNGVYNLTDADFVITGGNNTLNVTYYEDAGATTPIGSVNNYNAGNTTIYAVVDIGGCVSEPVPVDLSLIAIVESFDALDVVCQESNGMGTFNLTSLDATVNGGNGMTVNWYTDAQGTSPIADPANYNSSAGIVYAIVTNGTCDSEVASIQLDVTIIEAVITNLQTCDEGSGTGTFNLDDADNIINNNTGNFVSWYSDAGLTMPIAGTNAYNSGNGSVFAVVSDGTCFADAIEIPLAVVTNLAADPAALAECEVSNGESFFNLEDANNTVNVNSGLDVEWFLDMAGTMPIGNPTNYFGGNGTVYAQVVDGNCRSLITEVSLEVVQKPEALQFDHQECDDGTGAASFNLASLNGNVNTDGFTVTWYEDGLLTNEISGPFYSGNTTVYAVVSNGNCDSDPVDINLSVVSAKESMLDFTLCPGESVTIEGETFDETYPAGPVLLAGASAAGCDSIINVTVDFADLIAEFEGFDPTCFGQTNGQIFGNGIGGLEPYMYSIGDGFSIKNGFSDLAPGDYVLTVQDATGCEDTVHVSINEPVEFTIDLGDNLLIDLGETIDLFANTTLDLSEIETVIWTSTDSLTCVGKCLEQLNLSPSTSTTYTVEIIDVNGCSATDFITVTVQRQVGVYIPNIFTPNGDGKNNRFTVYGHENKVELVKQMSIYDRWGNRVYSLENFPVNVETIGWDGTFKGEKLDPAVFIYVVEVLFKDGTVEQYAGDLTLTR